MLFTSNIDKSVFYELNALLNQGFLTWVTKAYELVKDYDIDMDRSVMLTTNQLKSLCFERIFLRN